MAPQKCLLHDKVDLKLQQEWRLCDRMVRTVLTQCNLKQLLRKREVKTSKSEWYSLRKTQLDVAEFIHASGDLLGQQGNLRYYSSFSGWEYWLLINHSSHSQQELSLAARNYLTQGFYLFFYYFSFFLWCQSMADIDLQRPCCKWIAGHLVILQSSTFTFLKLYRLRSSIDKCSATRHSFQSVSCDTTPLTKTEKGECMPFHGRVYRNLC